MVKSILSEAPASPETRSALYITDEINRRLAQASAIFKLMGEPHSSLPDDTLSNAAWAGRDLLKQAKGLVGELRAKAAPAAEVANA